MGLKDSETRFTASGSVRPLVSEPDSCGYFTRLCGAAIKPLGVLLVDLRAPSIGSIALAALFSSVAGAALVNPTIGSGSNPGRLNVPVAEPLQGGIGHKASTLLPASNNKLPTLPGTGKQTRNDNRVLHTRLAGLGQRSNPILRSGQGLLWLNHSEPGAEGVGISVLPLNQNPQRLTIDGVYIDHAVSPTPSNPGRSHNRVWSLAVNSRWLNQRLTLHGEYAQSWQGQSAGASQHEPQSDRAYSLLAKYADQTYMFGSRPLAWDLTLSQQQAGGTFWSPTAGGVARNQAVTQAAANVHWGGLDARLGLVRATNNVAADAEVPTLHMNTVTAALHYTAQRSIRFPGLGRMFAAPSYALSLKRERSSLAKAPLSETADIPNSYMDTATLTARFTPGPWWWEVNFGRSMLRVAGQEAADWESNHTQLDLHLPLSAWLNLTPGLQWNLIDGQGSDGEVRMIRGTLGGSASLIPNRLAAKLNLSAQRHYNSSSQLAEAVAVESSLDWIFQPQQGNRPKITISLRGNYRYANSAGNGAVAQYQAFSEIQVSWPNAH